MPAATPTTTEATPAATARETDAPALQEIAPAPLDGLSLVVEVGCWACDGGIEQLVRVTSAGVEDLTAGVTASGPITSYVVADGGETIAAGRCVAGDCSLFGGPGEDAVTELVRSDDGGVSWRAIATVSGAAYPVAITPKGLLVVTYPGPQEPGAFSYEPGGELLWPSADQGSLLRGDGSAYVTLPPGGFVQTTAAHPADDRVAATWFAVDPASGTATYHLWIIEEGEVAARYASGAEPLFAWAWLDENALAGNLGGAKPGTYPRPVLIDVDTGAVSPLAGPFATTIDEADANPDLLAGRNFLAGAAFDVVAPN